MKEEKSLQELGTEVCDAGRKLLWIIIDSLKIQSILDCINDKINKLF